MEKDKDIKIKYLIIGAGISGLTFANYIKEDYIILEKENEIGGYCRTIKDKDFIWDYAGHFYHFKTDEMKSLFLENMSNNELVFQNKDTKIYYDNEKINYPFQMNIHQLPKEDFISCLYDLFNKVEKEEYNSFLDMLYGKFGKSIVEKFLKPYNEKLYACDLNELDKDAMGRFFPYANVRQIINNMKEEKNNSYNDTFLYPKAGAQSFINKIYNKLNKDNIFLSTKAETINLEDKIVITDKGKKIKYDYLINTAPLNQFLDIMEEEKYKSLINKLSYNKVLVFNLGFNAPSNYKEHWVYYPDKNINFYRVGFYNNILNSDKLSLYVEIGFAKDDNIDIKTELNKTLENLEKVGIVDNHELISYSTVVMDPAYVHIKSTTNDEINNLMEELEKNNIYSIGRYGAWTYCSMEDSMISAKQLANNLKKN